ncbi:MAG TPA: porin [Caulobacteraceae bacterium]
MRLIAGRFGLFGSAAAASLAFASGAFAAPQAAASASEERLERLEAAVAALQAAQQNEAALAKENAELKGEVSGLEVQVADLKASSQSQIQEIRQTAAAAPKLTLPNGRPTFSTADGKFTATLHGVMQVDAAQYDQSSAGNVLTDLRRSGPALGGSASNVDAAHARNLKDGDLFRRARIGLDGTVFKDWDYRLLFDFGGAGVENAGQVYEAWAQYSGLTPLRFRVGAFSPPIGLDDQASTNGMPFLERAVSSDLARGLAAGDTRTAAAIMANGPHWFVSGAVTGRTVGVINSGTIPASLSSTAGIGTAQTYGDQLGLVGRLAAAPIHGDDWLVHLGVHGSYVPHPANVTGPSSTGALPANAQVIALANTPELRVDGTRLINTGNIDANSAYTAGAEIAVQKQNFLLQSEFEDIGVDRADPGLSSPNFSGYYVSATWVLTGERRAYNTQTAAFDAPPVAHPFNLTGGGLGAFEIGVRWSDMNLNYHAGAHGFAPAADAIRGGEEQTLTAGLNWYLNPVVRLMFDYQHVRLLRLSPCGGPNSFTGASCASVWNTPVGAQIGQNYDVFSVRSQVAF